MGELAQHAPHSADLPSRGTPSVIIVSFPWAGMARVLGQAQGWLSSRAGLRPVQSVRLSLPGPGVLGRAGGLRLRAAVAPSFRPSRSQLQSCVLLGVCIPLVGSGWPPGHTCLALGACRACGPGECLAGPPRAGLRWALEVLRQHLSVLRCPWLGLLLGVTQQGPGFLPLVPLGWSRAEAAPAPAWCCLGPWPLWGGQGVSPRSRRLRMLVPQDCAARWTGAMVGFLPWFLEGELAGAWTGLPEGPVLWGWVPEASGMICGCRVSGQACCRVAGQRPWLLAGLQPSPHVPEPPPCPRPREPPELQGWATGGGGGGEGGLLPSLLWCLPPAPWPGGCGAPCGTVFGNCINCPFHWPAGGGVFGVCFVHVRGPLRMVSHSPAGLCAP